MSALMIANITVKNPEKFQEYIAKTSKVAATFGAELVYRAKVDKALNGDSYGHGLTIIVKFPVSKKSMSGTDRMPISRSRHCAKKGPTCK